MTMTIDPDILAALNRQAPSMLAGLDDLRANGTPFAHAIHNATTGEVFVSEGSGQPYERAHAWVRQMVTGIPYRDPGEVDPVFPTAAARDPILRVNHEAKVKDVILHLADFYRPDLARKTQNLPLLAEAMVTVILRSQGKLAALPTVYERWDMIAENMIEWMVEPPTIVPIGSRP